jgi:hypothetical protein
MNTRDEDFGNPFADETRDDVSSEDVFQFKANTHVPGAAGSGDSPLSVGGRLR